jgi:hypothetical protein
MSMTECKAYFRTQASAIGLKEWRDGFAFDNIPKTIFDKAYHLEAGPAVGVKLNQNDQEINFQVIVRIFVKGFRDPASGIDTAIGLTEDLLEQALDPATRLTQTTGIKQVTFESANFEPPIGDNDNLVIASVQFRVLTILGV